MTSIPSNTNLDEYLKHHVSDDDPIHRLIEEETFRANEIPEPLLNCFREGKDFEDYLDEVEADERGRIAEQLIDLVISPCFKDAPIGKLVDFIENLKS